MINFNEEDMKPKRPCELVPHSHRGRIERFLLSQKHPHGVDAKIVSKHLNITEREACQLLREFHVGERA
jgi:hypothetical protein